MDHITLQLDIEFLNYWAESNKKKLHPRKCKVIAIHNRPSPLAMLPFNFMKHHYKLKTRRGYAESVRHLGVLIDSTFTFQNNVNVYF